MRDFRRQLLPVVIGILMVLPFALPMSVQADVTADALSGSSSGAVAGSYLDASRGPVNYHAPDLSRRVPDTVAPSYPSANNCALGGGAAFSLAGASVSGGGHRESEECNQREDSTQAARLGDKATAFQIMCQKYRFYKGNRDAVRTGVQPAFTCVANEAFDRRIYEEMAEVVKEANRPLSTSSTDDNWTLPNYDS